ncbi:phage baseplate protein [Sporomusa aerivorans]|uniref:phage baseplate protein n=1 Tax=Sporomusa aerivorans TaxID=204936 RepID=UPI00352B2797
MDFSQQIAKLTGKYELINMVSGIANLDTFLFRTPKWPIGGVYFDGIMRTEHVSRVRPTQYPVQTGVTMTDHAIIEPAELTIEVMMSDCHTTSFVTNNVYLDLVYQSLQKISSYSNIVQINQDTTTGNGRSAKAWMTLKAMQLARQPLVVETRLQTYQNMLIEELSAPDDVKTLNALKTTVRLREIIVANVAETQTSARVAAYEQTNGGQVTAQTTDINKTAAAAGTEALGRWFGK